LAASRRQGWIVGGQNGGSYPEYVVVTGECWFFKTAKPLGAVCEFHQWPKAWGKGVAAAQPVFSIMSMKVRCSVTAFGPAATSANGAERNGRWARFQQRPGAMQKTYPRCEFF